MGNLSKELIVSNFLVFIMSSQLSYSFHVRCLAAKARGRCGFLFSRLPLLDLPLSAILYIFHLYITPILSYGSTFYVGNCSKAAIKSLNAVFTKYLKRYLFLPYFISNGLVHHLTGTHPLISSLSTRASKAYFSTTVPNSLSGMMPSIFKTITIPEPYKAFQHVPSFYWCLSLPQFLPASSARRRPLTAAIRENALNYFDLF
jgi:hypothetical protein